MWGGFRFRLQKGGGAEWRWRDGAPQEIFGWSSTVLKSLGLDVYLTFGLWEL